MNTSPLGWCQKPHYLNHFICDDIVIVKPLLFINVIIYQNKNSVNILNAGYMATNSQSLQYLANVMVLIIVEVF